MKTFETTRQEAKNVKNVSYLLDFLRELTPEEANLLLYSREVKVREYAIKYADRKSKIDRLLVEYNSNIVKGILNTIGELTPEEANKLLKANYTYVREYAVKYADRQSKINHLLIEDNHVIIDSILGSLDETPYYLICGREGFISYFAKYAERESKIKWLLVEHDFSVVDSILESLGELTPMEAYQLLNSKNRMAIIYAMLNVNSKNLAKLREIIIKELIN